MNNNSRFIKKRLSQIIAAGLLTGGVGMSAHAADFYLHGNAFELDGSVVTIASTGLTSGATITTTEIDSVSVPDLEFTLGVAAGAAEGFYTFKLHVLLESSVDNDRVQLNVGDISVEIDSNGDVTSILLNAESGSASLRKGSVNLNSINFMTPPGFLVTSGADVTLKLNEIVTAAKGSVHPDNQALVDAITSLNNAYTYRIGLQPVIVEETARIGFFDTGSSTFTAFPQTTFAGSGACSFTFNGGFKVGSTSHPIPAATALSDSASCAPASGGGDDEDEDPIVDEEVIEVIEENTQAIQDAVNSGNITPAIQDLATDTSNQAAEQTQRIVDAVSGGSSSVDPATLLQTVNTITGSTAVNTQVAANPDSSDSTQNTLVNNAIAITTGTATVLTTLAEQGADLTDTQVQQVNSIVNNTLDTLNNIADTEASTPAQLTELVKKANEITQARAQLGIPATAEESEKVAELSRELAVAVMSKVLGEDVTEDQIAEVLDSDSSLLEDIVNASLNLPFTATEPVATTQERIRAAYAARYPDEGGYAPSPSNTISAIPPGVTITYQLRGFFPNETVRFTLTGETAGSSNLALTDGRQILAATAEVSVTQNEVTGEVLIELPGESYSGVITAIKAVPESIPTGISFLANGTVLIVRDGLAVQLAPVSVDQLGFIGATLQADFTPAFNTDSGSFVLDLGGTQKFSGAFAYDNLTGKDLENCGEISFVEPTGALNSAGYAFVAKCSDNGVSQRITPYVYSSDFFDSLAGHGLSARIDRNTGFVTVAGVGRFKLGFFVDAPTSAESSYLAANGDANGLAFQGGDFNGDGRLDYKIISASGVQLLFGTN